MDGIRETSVVTLKGESGLWRVRYIGVALGGHYQEAHLERVGESMVKPKRLVPLADLTLAPADLEEWPMAPV